MLVQVILGVVMVVVASSAQGVLQEIECPFPGNDSEIACSGIDKTYGTVQ